MLNFTPPACSRLFDFHLLPLLSCGSRCFTSYRESASDAPETKASTPRQSAPAVRRSPQPMVVIGRDSLMLSANHFTALSSHWQLGPRPLMTSKIFGPRAKISVIEFSRLTLEISPRGPENPTRFIEPYGENALVLGLSMESSPLSSRSTAPRHRSQAPPCRGTERVKSSGHQL